MVKTLANEGNKGLTLLN